MVEDANRQRQDFARKVERHREDLERIARNGLDLTKTEIVILAQETIQKALQEGSFGGNDRQLFFWLTKTMLALHWGKKTESGVQEDQQVEGTQKKIPIPEGFEIRKYWESVIEQDERARAIIIQTLSWNGPRKLIAELLTGLGYEATEGGMDGRMQAFGGSGDRNARYVAHLSADGRLPSVPIMEKYGEQVRAKLVADSRWRQAAWVRFTDTRAIAVYLLEKGEKAGIIAKAIAKRLGVKMKNGINRSSLHHSMRGSGRQTLVEELKRGTPPYTTELTNNELQTGRTEGERLRKIVIKRLHEKASWMEEDDTRAFVLILIERGLPMHSIQRMVHGEFGLHIADNALWERVRKTEGNTDDEKRVNFVRIHMEDDDIDKKIYAEMEARAERAIHDRKYFIDVQRKSAGKAGSTKRWGSPEEGGD